MLSGILQTRLVSLLAAGLLWAGLVAAQININTANKEQLDGLKGIGPTKAQAIIDYRTKNGPFQTIEDVQNVPGIGPATLNDIRRDIAVNGVSRAPVAGGKPVKAGSATEMARPSLPPTAAKPPVTASPKAESAASPAPAQPARPSAADKPVTPVSPARPAIPGAATPAKPAQPPVATTNALPSASGAPAAPARPAQPKAGETPAKPAAPARPAAAY